MITRLAALLLLSTAIPAFAGQAPGRADVPDIAISKSDRFYTSDQFSNTVSVIDPSQNKLLGVIKLGEPTPANLSPLYRGQVLVHGMGFSPDHKTLAVISIGSNSVSFIDTETNAVKHTAYVGRSPHEAFFRPDGKEVWVSIRGEDYIQVLDGENFAPTTRIKVPNGPGMTIFSPDGRYGYVCSSFSPETVVIDTGTKKIVGSMKQDSPFCPDIAATPDGAQVWLTLKDIGKTMVFNAKPPFQSLKVLDTGPITNHVNIVRNGKEQFAYVTVGGLNLIKVFRTDGFEQVASIPVGALPHGLWPSGDGTRVYVGLENADAAAVIDTASNKVIETIPLAAKKPACDRGASGRLFAVTGLEPKQPYVLALAASATGDGVVQPLAAFMSNPAGAAIVNAVGPIRQVVSEVAAIQRRYLVIVEGMADKPGKPVQIQKP
ncbi:MAG: hypothetical protein B7Z14_10045 [Bosea sp. 32-68-6]|nr:MAG: hypothetical protein B7Z14_10045 [Bosea sp. 32-68-6]